jgi:hypothetical protein
MEGERMLVKVTIVHEGQTFSGEVEVNPVGTQKTLVRPRVPALETSTDSPTKPSGAVEFLYRRGFFKESRRLADVFAKLSSDGFNFSRQSIFMAMRAAPFLAVTGRRGAYAFVQKFPPRN